MLEKREELDKLMLESLSNEYQSIWLCEVETQKMSAYMINAGLAIPEIEDIGNENQYDRVRSWYIENYIMEDQRDRIREETELTKIVSELEISDKYVVEYNRVVNDSMNYNQIYYTRVNDRSDKITRFVFGFRDFDYKKKAEKDELTGIFNRKAFFWHAENMMRKNPDKKYDLILSDYVNFKNYNEAYGAKKGDELLAAAGKYLSTLSPLGAVVGRYGGDQFVVLLEQSGFDEFMEVVNGRKTIVKEDSLPAAEVKFGICRNIDPDNSVLLYCDRAHIAVNTIKHIYGTKTAEFNEDIQKLVEKQRAIEADMQEALDNDQFQVYYQPKHDTNTGRVVGAEALVRWIHPKYGFMSPAEFIPVFERNGFIVKLDYFVFERSCENLRKWLDEGSPVVPISINASKLTVESQGMVYNVNKAMRRNNIPGNLIHIEITESLMSNDSEMLIRRLEPLKDRGILVELDDFGAGYASINMLSTLPLDVIKLDMSFMKQFGDYKRAKVLEGCVNLAKSLGYKTVSEGVETEEQLNTLKKLGVDIIQGYYYSKPLPLVDFEEYIIKNY